MLVYAGPPARELIDELEAEHAYGRSVLDEIDYLLTSEDQVTARLIAERLSWYAHLPRRLSLTPCGRWRRLGLTAESPLRRIPPLSHEP